MLHGPGEGGYRCPCFMACENRLSSVDCRKQDTLPAGLGDTQAGVGPESSPTYGLLGLPLVRLHFGLQLVHQVLEPQDVLAVLLGLRTERPCQAPAAAASRQSTHPGSAPLPGKSSP